jgi:ribosome biogenesis GTPase
MIATVYKSTGSWYNVKSESGRFFNARMKGVLKLMILPAPTRWQLATK